MKRETVSKNRKLKTEKIETKNLDDEIVKLTYKQLQKFHLEAFNQGADARLVCGGLGSLDEVNPQFTNLALYKALAKED